MSDINRILEEIRDIEEAKTIIVDELDRALDARYKEVSPGEGEVWYVTLTHPDAHSKAHYIPAIKTAVGWVADPKWGHDENQCTSDLGWREDDVYPHHKLR